MPHPSPRPPPTLDPPLLYADDTVIIAESYVVLQTAPPTHTHCLMLYTCTVKHGTWRSMLQKLKAVNLNKRKMSDNPVFTLMMVKYYML